MTTEPKEAFPYLPPSAELKQQYSSLFDLDRAVEVRFPKRIFDIFLSGTILLFCLPIILLLFVLNLLEGIFIRENAGPLFFYYYGVSQGKKFKKWKIRLIKEKFIDEELQKVGDWHACLQK